jgi:CHAD domain-containing protein
MEPSCFTSSEARLGEVCRALADAAFVVGSWVNVRRTVLDTFDGRVNAAGLRLEVRDGQQRELVLTGGGTTAHVAVSAAPRVGSDLPPGPLRGRLAPILDVRALLPMLVVTGRRAVAVRQDSRGKRQVGVVLHGGVSLEGAAGPTPLGAAEVEELQGYPKAADRTRRLLRSLGLEAHGGDVVDLLADAAGVDLRGHVVSPTVALDRSEPALDGFRRVLARLAGEVEANWSGTVDALDSEFLHELRVAVRRTRSVLSQAKRVLPDDVRARYRDGFGWLGAITSPARDLDVYVIEWDEYVDPLGTKATTALRPLRAHIVGRRDAEYASLVRALRSERYRALMRDWRAWLDGAADVVAAGRDAASPVGSVAADRISAAQVRLVSRGRAIDRSSPGEALHELRKDAKRLRYLLECFGGVLPRAARKVFVQRLKALQDNLGEFQDTEVHAAQLRASSHELVGSPGTTAETFVAIGQLAERFELRRQAAREEFGRRYATYDTKETARILDGLLRSAARR